MKPQRLSNEEIKSLECAGNTKLEILGRWMNDQFTCSHCGKCKRRCDVLQRPDLDMGQINNAYDSIMQLDEDEQLNALYTLVQEKPELYHALRQCCFCGHCTAACARHIAAPESMRAWRELFMRANWMPPDDSRLVMVDNEWNIFSAYRAIHQIAYPNFVTLDAASEYGPGWVDTLLFPGCSLVSYAPNVMEALGQYLNDCGVSWAFSDGCCGSPLMSAGMFERAHVLRMKFINQMIDAGITKMVTICPGCTDEFKMDIPESIELVPLPELLIDLSKVRETSTGKTGFASFDSEGVTFFDSCHDRDDIRNAMALRQLLSKNYPEIPIHEMEHTKRGTLCCGAGGAVGSYDAAITNERVWRVINEAKDTTASALITMCPTCTYTVAQALLEADDTSIINLHYLEVLLGERIDWKDVFDKLNSMWTGEYGPWLNQTFFS